ncbi:MAG: hypothetical protein GY845_07305 [Planctomycetes bacterium]|nr:hypothetical protein [Planctomycetota bacterium]
MPKLCSVFVAVVLVFILSSYPNAGTQRLDNDSVVDSSDIKKRANEILHGFRGFEWSTSYHTMKYKIKMNKLDADLFGFEAYIAPEIKRLGGATIENCVLLFYRKQYCGALIYVNNSLNFEALLRAAKKVYGEPIRPSRYREEYEWSLERTVRTAVFDAIKGSGYLSMFSVPHIKWKEKDLKKEEESVIDEF